MPLRIAVACVGPGRRIQRLQQVPRGAKRCTSQTGLPPVSLPLPGPETVSLAARPSAIYPAGPYPVLGVAEVRQLGLSDGQIVRPTVEVRNERLMLLLDGRVIEWPGGVAPRAAAGSLPPAMAWMVRLLANGSAQLLPVRGREPAAEPSAPAAGLPRSDAPAAAAARAPESSESPGLPPRWAQLLVRPGALSAWTAALQSTPNGSPPPALAAAGSAAMAVPPVLAPLLSLISMGLLDGAALRDAVRRSGLFAESRLARGERADLSDVKLGLLARWRAAEAGGASASAALASALEDDEAAQLQSLAASADGGVVLHLALGFRDAPPLTLRLGRDPPPAEGEPAGSAGWTVDIHSHSEAWGPLWLQTRVEADGRIGLVMWAEREAVCNAARADVERLTGLLGDEGLRLDRFQVIHGPRRDPSPAQAPARAGAVLDLRV